MTVEKLASMLLEDVALAVKGGDTWQALTWPSSSYTSTATGPDDDTRRRR